MGDPIQSGAGAAHPLMVAVDEIDRAERLLRHRVRTTLGLNNSDYTALLYIDRRERRGLVVHVGELSDHLSISTAAASTIVDRLSRAGFVERRADPGDGRGRTLRTTPSSRERLEVELGAMRALLDALVAEVDRAEEQRMLEMLRRVRDILSPDPAAP